MLQFIISRLKKEPCTAQDLATLFKTDLKEILESLEQIKHKQSLKYSPAKCKGCGFQFKDRKTFKTPSKCPRCKSESIKPVYFKIEK